MELKERSIKSNLNCFNIGGSDVIKHTWSRWLDSAALFAYGHSHKLKKVTSWGEKFQNDVYDANTFTIIAPTIHTEETILITN